jgi:hypothetical protein
MAITSWTSEGMTWPPTAGYRSLNPMEAIRLALAERCAVSGNALLAPIASPFSAGIITRQDMVNIESELNEQIPLFVNHTDNAGDWDGIGTKSPMWSTTSIMAYLGESRLAVPAAGNRPNDWLHQQYNIINLLRWTRRDQVSSGITVTGEERTGSSTYATSWTATYSAAVTAWDAASWTGAGTLPAAGYSAKWVPDLAADRVYIQRQRSTFSLGSLPSGVSSTVVWHAYTQSPPWSGNTNSGTLDPAELVFDDEGLGYTDDAWNAFETATDNTTTRTSGYVGNIATAPAECADPVATESALGWALPSDGESAVYAVIKWNVTGGFAFV